MPRIFAIDWDRREVRGLLINSGPTGTSIAGAWATSLTTADPNGLTGKQIGARLAAAMAGPVSGKVTTLVSVPRDDVQMQLFALPPAPADELPDLVRFQADRDFTALGPDAALDYIPIAGDAQTPHQVLAVALNTAGVSEARELCNSLGVVPDRIPLRACAPAALVHRAGLIDSEHVALIVNPLTDEADLTVQAGDKIVLMRTVRLPEASNAEARHRALLGEIRRTMAAVRQQLADRKVEQVIVCGNESSFGTTGTLTKELDVPAADFDIASQAPSGLASHGVPADSLARFAAVLGMALAEADRRAPIVDFANVRRKAERSPFGRTHKLAVAAAVLAALALGVGLWRQLAAPARELAEINAEIAAKQPQVDKYDAFIAREEAVNRWLATDVNWLDELEQLARRVRPQPLADKNFPVDDDIVVTQLTLARFTGTEAVGGFIDLQAAAKNDAAIRDLEQRLRDDDGHRVMPGSQQADNTLAGYPRSTELRVVITPSAEEDATSDETAAEPQASNDVATTENGPASKNGEPSKDASLNTGEAKSENEPSTSDKAANKIKPASSEKPAIGDQPPAEAAP